MEPIILIVLVMIAIIIVSRLFVRKPGRDFPIDAPKGQVHTPPPPLLSMEAVDENVGLLFVIQPSSHLCYHQFIPYYNNGGLQLENGDEVEFETRTAQVEVSGTPQNMYYAINLRKTNL